MVAHIGPGDVLGDPRDQAGGHGLVAPMGAGDVLGDPID